MSTPSPNHPIVLVVWTDTISNSGWKQAEDIDDWTKENTWLVHTVGYLIRETEEFVVIAASWAMEEKQYGSLIKIPRAWAKVIPLTDLDSTQNVLSHA